MTGLTVGALPVEAAALVAQLLADRQQLFRNAWHPAEVSFENPLRCLELLEPMLKEGKAFGAWKGSRLVGFVAGISHGRLGVIPAAGHAVQTGDVDAADVYGNLYSELAEYWIGRGVLVHDVEIPAVWEIENAWNNLGFGRRVCIGSRSTEVLSGDANPAPGVEIRIAGADDLPAIVRLAAMEVEFRSGPPMYLEGGPPDPDLLRKVHGELLNSGEVHFVAIFEREIVGFLTLLQESRFPPICAENAPFVSTTVTDPRHRRRKIGRVLVRAAADWALERGYEQMDVSFQIASPLLRSFWRQAGFKPIGWKVARRLPESLGKRIKHA